MENLIVLLLALCCVLPSTGCETITTPEIEVLIFSFAEDSQTYQENEPGVRTEDFENASSFPINNAQDAINRAQNECTVEYDTTAVCYDDETDMWRVSYYKEGYLGGDQNVYLDSNGITHLIVYGE